MLNINMEFNKGVLFIRLEGSLTKKTIDDFDSYVIPVILKHGIKYVVVNLDKLNVIDIKGIEVLMKLNEVVSLNNGKISLCSLTSNQVKNSIHNSVYNNDFYETSDELTAIKVIRI